MKTNRVKNVALSLVICLFLLQILSIDVFAASPAKASIAKGKTTLSTGETLEIPFTTQKKMIFTTPVKITFKDNIDGDDDFVDKGGIRIQLKDAEGNLIQNDYLKIRDYYSDDTFQYWWYSDNYYQKPGDYTYCITNSTNLNWSIKYSVNGYTGYPVKATAKKKVSVKRDNWVKIGKLGTGYPSVKKFSSSNKKIVKDYSIEEDGTVYVLGRKTGKAKVTIKLKNGKKYSTNVTVKAKDPDLYACLYDYNTRNNYFTVKVKNCGDRSVSIIRKGAKVIDVDYKSYDRKIKNAKSVTVKPGKTKYIRFYCKGSTTWYDYTSFTLYAKFKCEGKTYVWHTWDEDSVIKKGKKWYSSYWDEDDYSLWNPNIEYDDEEDYDDDDYDDYDDEDYDDYDDEDYDDEEDYDEDYDEYDDYEM